MSGSTIFPVAIGLAIGIGFIVIFAAMFPFAQNISRPRDIVVLIPLVTIQEGALASGGNFEPATIKLVIGTNNTVRWINRDLVMSSVVADNDNDPGFYNATNDATSGPTDQSNLLSGESFEYTFTKPGVFGYHSVPHPQLKGTVIVFPQDWLTNGYVPTEPVKYEYQAIESVENYLRDRVNNFVGITLYSSSPTIPSNHSRYLNTTDFFELGEHLPLRYSPPDSSDSFYSIDPIEHKITGKCINTACLPFNPAYSTPLKGKLVYLVDSAWIYKRNDGELANLPDGFFVDAYTGDIVATSFHCPEQRQEWCK